MPDHDRLESIFIDALEFDSANDRADFMERACGDDRVLLEHVRAMVENHAQADSFMTSVQTWDTVEVEPCTSSETTIGPYLLLEKAGEGGFGIVYRAEQQQPIKRIVALKQLKPGMDSSQVVTRFEHERQALALMDHPNIARVLDAGTTLHGRPYFVMEYFDGLPISQYCDEHQLNIRERLELFLTVCQAVHYSHHKGIIHRDLKPSNVLVSKEDGKHILKVIDFGIAKAIGQKLTDQTLMTTNGSFVGTLEYMSPEQACLNAIDIDTRADIYGLGVLLFELLTGTTPLARQQIATLALDEVLRMIREVESPLASARLAASTSTIDRLADSRCTDPSRLCKAIEGELDWIIAKCLEKDRARRYDSASGLARDIERYLNDEAIEAGPPSAWYKFRKFSRRHWRSLAAAACAFILLLATTVTMTMAFVAVSHEQHQKELALEAEQQRRRETRAALDAMSSVVIEDWLVRQSTLLPQHKKFLQDTVQFYEQFAQSAAEDRESRSGAANASYRVGQMLDKLGQTQDAESAWLRARDGYRTLAAQFPDEDHFQSSLASVYQSLAGIYSSTGRNSESEAARENTLHVYEQLASRWPNNTEYRQGLAVAKTRLAILYKNSRRYSEATELYEAARRAQTELVQQVPGERTYRRELAQTLLNLGLVLELQERPVESEDAQREGILHLEHVRAQQPGAAYDRDALATIFNNLGNLLRDQDKPDSAEVVFRQSLELRRELAREFPIVPEYARGLAMTLSSFGILLKNSNRIDAALESYREAVVIHRQLATDHPEIVNYKNELGGAMVNLARVYLNDKQFDEARQLLVEAEPYHRDAVTTNPKHPTYRHFYRLNRWRLAETCIGLEDHRSAAKAIEQFYELATELPRDSMTAASLWCQCKELSDLDPKLADGERNELALQYGGQAVQMIKMAIERDPKIRATIKLDEAFDGLRSRADFQACCASDQ